jgi:phage FluMu gp28-like protein
MNPDAVLRGAGRTEYNRNVLAKLQQALPPREWEAVSLWISQFYGFQQTWLLDREKFSLLLKCRQIGASHTYAAASVLWGIFAEETSIISEGEREATDVLKKVVKHATALEQFGSKWARVESLSATRCGLASRGTIVALPATSGGRGKSGNILLDEMGYYQHPKEVWDGAAAVVTHGGKLRGMSTPNGVGNLFHTLWSDPRANKGYRKHRVTLDDARADGMVINDAECWSMAHGDSRLYQQLFCCEFLDGNLQFISSDLVNAASVDDLYTYEGEYFGGLDIGRTVDRTVLIVVRKRPDEHRVLAWIASCKRTDFDALEALVEWAFQVFKLRRLCVDATGMGAFPAERLQKKHGQLRVEPVVFSQPVKEDLATTLYSAFAEQNLSIAKTDAAIRLPYGISASLVRQLEPKAAEQLRTDVCAIRREITSAGNVRYDAPRTDEGHADSAWALALALHACGKAPGKKFVVEPQSVDSPTQQAQSLEARMGHVILP